MPFEIMLFLLCATDFTLVDGGATTKSLLSNRKFLKLFFELIDPYSTKNPWIVRKDIDLGTFIRCNVTWLSVGGRL